MASMHIVLLCIVVASASAFFVQKPIERREPTECADKAPKADCEVLKKYDLCYTEPARKLCGTTCEDTCGAGCIDHAGMMCQFPGIKEELCPGNRAYNVRGAFLACPKSCGLCNP